MVNDDLFSEAKKLSARYGCTVPPRRAACFYGICPTSVLTVNDEATRSLRKEGIFQGLVVLRRPWGSLFRGEKGNSKIWVYVRRHADAQQTNEFTIEKGRPLKDA